MTSATLQRPAPDAELAEELLGVVRLDGDRHSLVWIHNPERTLSVLVDRPNEGAEKVRLLGTFAPEESRAAIETLIADYREHHIDRAPSERIHPRPIEPDDLIAPAGREGGGRYG